MKKILVTGGAGYIGSHTCKRLAQKGYVPVTFDNLVYGHESAVKWGPFYKGDLFEQNKLREVIEKEKIEAVIHFAAFAYVGESVKEPTKYYQNNVAGTISLLKVMQEMNVKKMIFSSTCATYGMPDAVPITEDCPQRPINPYGESKLMVEKILKDLCQSTDFRAVALRYFNASGADIDAEIGECHDPETHLIPLALQAATDSSKPLTIFGKDYPTEDGTCVRDYIHVTDLADAHILALEKISALPERMSVFNLGTGQGYSVAEILAQAEIVTEKKIPHSYGPRRAGDPAKLIANGEKAKEILGWEPKQSGLRTILETAWHWHVKQLEGTHR